MPAASWAQINFLGGEISKTAQGRFDDPSYRIALNVCLNWIPIEAGALTRRPGTQFAGTTRGGNPGRVTPFSLRGLGYTMEFTDGFIRFRNGAVTVTTNDDATVTAISAANPAVITLSAAVTWSTGNNGFFKNLGANNPRLQNRQFTLTKVDTTHFSLADAITGAGIDGSTLGTFVSGTFARVLELSSPYVASAWSSSSMRSVLCDIPLANGSTQGAVLLNRTIPPYVVQVSAQPTLSAFATFTGASVVFKDGPYFDPVPGGTLAVPSAQVGIIMLTLSFNTYSSTVAYSKGDYVTSSSVNYKSLIDANVGNTPASSPSAWTAVAATDPLGSAGFTNADIGRHVRLFSEPPLWAASSTYSAGNVVAYGGTGEAAAGADYWVSLTGSNTGNIPGTDTTHWATATNAATWTWGRITGLSNIISGSTGVGHVGTMTLRGGLSAAFDGALSKTLTQSAAAQLAPGGLWVGGSSMSGDFYVGQNYTGTAHQISQVTVYPTSDIGFMQFGVNDLLGNFFLNLNFFSYGVTVNLRAKSTAPANASDGTLLGTSGAVFNAVAPITVLSSDQSTSWNYVWVELIATANYALGTGQQVFQNPVLDVGASQVVFIAPFGTGTSQGINVQIVGAALQYSGAVRTWRLGLFNGNTGYPTCGTFHEDGRLFLAGVVGNRFDASRSDDPFNMAPTDPDGSVPDNAAITYTLTAKDIQPILGMDSDERGIIARTQSGEWLVTATTQNLALSPTNIQAHQVTRYGSEPIEAVRAGGVLVFVQRFARDVLEYFADVFSGRMAPKILTRDAKHLTQTFIEEIAFQQQLAPVIWARRGDGGLIGCTYKRENMMSSSGPNFMGWHRHDLGSGRVVESICTGPSIDGELDALTMVTNDTTTNIRHVEVMTNIWEEGDDITSAWHLDDAVAPSSMSINFATNQLTANGLWHLNGKSVAAFVAGIDAGNYTVANGSITVPLDGTANPLLSLIYTPGQVTASSPVVVGFPYNSDGQLLRLAQQKESGAVTGAALGKMSRTHEAAVLVTDAAGGNTQKGLMFGADFGTTLLPALFRQFYPSGALLPENQLFTGVYRASIKAPHSIDNDRLTFRAARMLPATICAIGTFQDTEG